MSEDIFEKEAEIKDAGSVYPTYSMENAKVEETEKEKKKRKKEKRPNPVFKFVRKTVAVVFLGTVLGGCAGGGFYLVTNYLGMDLFKPDESNQNIEVKPTNVANTIAVTESEQGKVVLDNEKVTLVTSDVSEMVEDVMPAMVSIVNTYTSNTNYWGHTYTQESQSSGSGIIVAQSDTELIIVTNHHVIENEKELEVSFINGETAAAQVKGSDADMDLAVIAISLDSLSKDTLESIAVASIGDSESVKLGENVIAIGNALGYGQSVTGGYISAVNREIKFSDGTSGKFIQTDAAINPGNSGGALLNIKGEVIGINSCKIGGSNVDGMGFAIPISNAKPIIEELMAKETKKKNTSGKSGYLGVEPITITDEVAYMYGYPKGVFVRSVGEDTPAEKAGVYSGDIIVAMEGDAIATYEDLQQQLTYYEPGTTITLTVKRQINGKYEKVNLEVTLSERPEE